MIRNRFFARVSVEPVFGEGDLAQDVVSLD